MYESLTKVPYGDTNLEYALNVVPAGIALSGVFDQIHLLRYESDDAILSTVRQILEKQN